MMLIAGTVPIKDMPLTQGEARFEGELLDQDKKKNMIVFLT